MSFDEAGWWEGAINTYHEEQKQIVYAARMGLIPNWAGAHPPTFNADGKSIIDIGGGPVSLLLKTVNRKRSVVTDPGRFPEWVSARYLEAKIEYWCMEGESESLSGYTFDEAWIYNCMVHTRDPERIIANAKGIAQTLRIFEWIDMPAYDGHPQELTQARLEEWIGAPGFATEVNQDGAVGRCFYGVFSFSD